ncbi:ankyrin, partial [Piromyces finnis]
ASKIGNIEMVKYLIENGIYLYTENNKGRDSVMNALIFNHSDIAKYSFNKGSEFFKNKNKCITYLNLACKIGLIDIAEYLIYKGEYSKEKVEKKKKVNTLLMACFKGNYEIVNILIESGTNIYEFIHFVDDILNIKTMERR